MIKKSWIQLFKSTTVLSLSAFLLLFTCYQYYLCLNSMRMKTLAGTPINDSCSRQDLSVFDRSVCKDEKLDGLFVVYIDGAPFELYKDFIEKEPYKSIASARMADNQGISDSGPSFRSAIIGRYDIDYESPLGQLDNHLNQYLRVINKNMSLMVYFDFPVVQNIGLEYFANFYKMGKPEDGPAGMCPKLFIMNSHTKDFSCDNPLSCQFNSIKEATDFVIAKTEEYLTILQPIKQQLTECLDRHFQKAKSFFVYQEMTDDEAHTWSWKNKVTADLHAATRANLIFIAEYLRQHHPSTLIAFYSDHGANEDIWHIEWENHGNGKENNKGFMIIMNDMFASKSKRPNIESQDTTNIWTGVSLSLANVNLPRYHQQLPEPRFQNESHELLQIYRTRELQIRSVLDKLSGDSPVLSAIDSSKSVSQNIQAIGQIKMEELLKIYKDWLLSHEAAYEQEVKAIKNRDLGASKPHLIELLAVNAIFLVAFLIYFGEFNNGLKPSLSTSMMMVFSWILWMCIEGRFTSFDYCAMSYHYLYLFCFSLLLLHKLRNKKMQAAAIVDDGYLSHNLRFYAGVSCLLATLIVLIQTTFKITRWMNWNRYLVYFLDRPTTTIGWIVTVISGFWMLFESWRQIITSAGVSWRQYNKFKLVVMVCNTTAVLSIIWSTIKYDSEVLKNKDLSNGEYQQSLVKNVYKSLVFIHLSSNFLLTSIAEKNMLMVSSLLFMSFWACNLARILLCTLVTPCVVLLTRRLPHDRRVQSPIFVGLLVVFLVGFSNSTGEQYLFHVSQRAVKRYPFSHADSNLVLTGAHIFFIKFCSSVFINSLLVVCKVKWSLLNEYIFILFNVLLFIPFAYIITTTDRLKQNYLLFLVNNLAISVYGLWAKLAQCTVALIIRCFKPVSQDRHSALAANADQNELQALSDTIDNQPDKEVLAADKLVDGMRGS